MDILHPIDCLLRIIIFYKVLYSSDDYYDLEAYYYYVSRDQDAVLDGTGDKNNGASCRCVQD